jgi:hypothetical protein
MYYMNRETLTFVTSFADIYETQFEEKSVEWRFDKFRDIAGTGIPLCVYVDPVNHIILQHFARDYPNIKIMKTITIWDTEIGKTVTALREEGHEITLPQWRNEPKDIDEYMILINSKTEFMADAVEKNPWQTKHFAWIDFSISYVFHNKLETLRYLEILAKRTFTGEPFLLLPGCWDRLNQDIVEPILNNVFWRFCGGFMLGDTSSILDLHERYRTHFAGFLREHQKLTWEVNFWAWLEANTGWKPTWYKADHNDCIIHVPVDKCCLDMSKHLTIQTYDYPAIETYEPMQASYLSVNGRHWLNTRYVNYWYLESGHCHIKHSEDIIITKNLTVELDGETLLPISSFREMREDTVGLHSFGAYFYGLEDIRLYEVDGQMRFVATNINYSPSGHNKMIVGGYDPETQCYADCRLIEPPYQTWCEKNWIPVIQRDQDTGKTTEKFIYKWHPMEIGQIRYSDDGGGPNQLANKLEIVASYNIREPEFSRVRGSTPFILVGDYLVGIVHFSECTLPRRYYHIMLALDPVTLQPLKYSETFHFLHVGIEFCIGLTVRDEDYICWISTWDREPAMVRLPRSKIPLCFDFSS